MGLDDLDCVSYYICKFIVFVQGTEGRFIRSVIMISERTKELYKVLLSKGYPKEFCAEVAYKNMNTDYTATRMLGYLYRYTNPRIEDLVDEMLAILSDRNQLIEKKESEHAQAVISEMYRKGL